MCLLLYVIGYVFDVERQTICFFTVAIIGARYPEILRIYRKYKKESQKKLPFKQELLYFISWILGQVIVIRVVVLVLNAFNIQY